MIPTQAYQEHAFLRGFDFTTGSKGSILSGMKLEILIIDDSNITVTRNWITHNQVSISIDFSSPSGHDSIIIEQNFLHVTGGTSTGILFWADAPYDSTVIRNNVIITNGRCISISKHAPAHNFIVENNIFNGDMSISHANFIHNIWIDGVFAGGDSHNICSYNMSSAEQFLAIGGANNNQVDTATHCINVDMSTVFEDPASAIDKGYLLKAGSPAASGSGEMCIDVNNTELGIFGGSAPFRQFKINN